MKNDNFSLKNCHLFCNLRDCNFLMTPPYYNRWKVQLFQQKLAVRKQSPP